MVWCGLCFGCYVGAAEHDSSDGTRPTIVSMYCSILAVLFSSTHSSSQSISGLCSTQTSTRCPSRAVMSLNKLLSLGITGGKQVDEVCVPCQSLQHGAPLTTAAPGPTSTKSLSSGVTPCCSGLLLISAAKLLTREFMSRLQHNRIVQ